jgi:hypothetical protein
MSEANETTAAVQSNEDLDSDFDFEAFSELMTEDDLTDHQQTIENLLFSSED